MYKALLRHELQHKGRSRAGGESKPLRTRILANATAASSMALGLSSYLLPLLAIGAAGTLPVSAHSSHPYPSFSSLPDTSHGQQLYPNSIHAQYPVYSKSAYLSNSVNPTYSSRTVNQTFQDRDSQKYAQSDARGVKGRPTVLPARYFNPQQDATRLRNTLKSIANPDVIIEILTTRSNNQRQIILQYYSDLKNDLRWKLSFSFRDVMEALMTRPQTFITLQLEETLRFSTSIDEKRLVELLGSLNNTQIRLVKEEYRKTYGRSLQDDMTRFSLYTFTKFFSSYIGGERDESSWVDHVLATKDAEALKKSGKLSIDTGTYFRYILSYRSFNQLNRTFVEYQRVKRESIEQTIKKDFSGKVRDGLLSVVKSITNRVNYFAEILNEGMKSLRTRDSTLIRIIVLRSETDMGDIKDSYGRLYGMTLDNAISKNTSGSFKKTLLSLISG